MPRAHTWANLGTAIGGIDPQLFLTQEAETANCPNQLLPDVIQALRKVSGTQLVPHQATLKWDIRQ